MHFLSGHGIATHCIHSVIDSRQTTVRTNVTLPAVVKARYCNLRRFVEEKCDDYMLLHCYKSPFLGIADTNYRDFGPCS